MRKFAQTQVNPKPQNCVFYTKKQLNKLRKFNKFSIKLKNLLCDLSIVAFSIFFGYLILTYLNIVEPITLLEKFK